MPDELTYDSIEVGKEYGPYYYPLRDRIDRHLEAVQNEHPWHKGRSPWGPRVAPPTILGNATLRFLESIALLPLGTLQSEQEFEFKNALRLDRKLIGYAQFVDKFERRGRRWFAFEARFRDETGLIIGRSQTTLTLPERVEDEDTQPGVRQESGPRSGELSGITRRVTQDRVNAYVEDSANVLRGVSLHANEEAAQKAGFRTTILPGLISADYVSEMMTGIFGQEWFLWGAMSLSFLRPAFTGDTITANGRLLDAMAEGAYERRMYEVWCENERGDAVALGRAAGLISQRAESRAS